MTSSHYNLGNLVSWEYSKHHERHFHFFFRKSIWINFFSLNIIKFVQNFVKKICPSSITFFFFQTILKYIFVSRVVKAMGQEKKVLKSKEYVINCKKSWYNRGWQLGILSTPRYKCHMGAIGEVWRGPQRKQVDPWKGFDQQEVE